MTADGRLDLLGREHLYLDTCLLGCQRDNADDLCGRQRATDVLVVKHPLDRDTIRDVDVIEFADLLVDVEQPRSIAT